MPCGCNMIVVVPKGEYDYKEVTVKCGNTMPTGDPYLCDTCVVADQHINWRERAAEFGETYDEDI